MPTPLVNGVPMPPIPGTGCDIKFYQGTPFLYLNGNCTSYETQTFLTGVELRQGWKGRPPDRHIYCPHSQLLSFP